jgi:CheY-like chemotaxis protein
MSNKKILFVDDDPDERQAMHLRLRSGSYDTFFATDAMSCVSEARKQEPDLIILDLGLAGSDGYVVMERLKKYPALGVIPIIVLSARDARDNRNQVIAAGAKVYVQKPVKSAELLAVIRQTLGEPEQPGDAGVTGIWKLLDN